MSLVEIEVNLPDELTDVVVGGEKASIIWIPRT
jgi:hypothetical protein